MEKPIEGYENRGQLFLKKLKAGEAFTMTDGSSEVLYTTDEGMQALEQMVQSGDFSGFSKKVKIYRKSNDKKVPMNQIEKTAEFGSSGGAAGAGTAITDLAESAAAITAVHYKKNGFTGRKEYLKYLEKLSHENMTREFSQVSDGFNVTSSIEEVATFLLGNRSWLFSSCSSAEAIDNELNLSSSTVIHRGSKVMDEIYKKAMKLVKESGIKIGADK